MNLHALPKLGGKQKKAKRVGRGYGSGRGGHTSGRGTKGQKARNMVRPGFEGGQNPLYKALPKARGFKAFAKIIPTAVNVRDIDRKFKDSDVITIESLAEVGLINAKEQYVKVLGDGEMTKKVTLKGLKVSKSAKEKIEKAGGKVI